MGPSPESGGWLLVGASGPLATVQDLGRPGHAHEGVPPSGAADPRSHRLANRLVGNPPGAATIEVTLGGLSVLLGGAGAPRTVAVTGAAAPMTVGGRPAALYAPVALRPGEEVVLGTPERGLRSYLAVAGGITVPAELGSRSTDLLSGLGPPPLRAGGRIPLGPPPAGAEAPPGSDVAAAGSATPAGPGRVGIVPGPRADRLPPGGWETLTGVTWTVTAASNRVGLRLSGPRLPTAPGELAPEGLCTGAIQVPPGGQPVVFLADHPVTGGYPVVGVVGGDADLATLAQLRPGDRLELVRPVIA